MRTQVGPTTDLLSISAALTCSNPVRAGLREAAWMKFKDAVKHIGRGGAGVPGVLVEETARMDAKLKEINDKLRNFVSAS